MTLRFTPILVLGPLLLLTVPGLVGCSNDNGTLGGTGGSGATGGTGGTPSGTCSEVAAEASRTCVSAINAAWEACYNDTNLPCASDNTDVTAALSSLESDTRAGCADGEFGELSVDALVGRLQNSCASETSSLATRTYGGPMGVVWADATANDQACLQTAHENASTLIDDAFLSANACLAAADCDPATVQADRDAARATALSNVEASCAELEELIAVPADLYVNRALLQADCLVATANADPGDLSLACGPSNVTETLPRGEYAQVTLDGDKWDTVCGDGSPYSFWIRLAPEGQPLDRIVIGLQGGGVCFFDDDCSARFANNPGLFTSEDDVPFESGIASNDPDESPFGNWTKVYLPYCNQDVFGGRGVTEEFAALDLQRNGGTNLRSAIRYTRDLIWGLMDEDGGAGFRPDELVALFGGFSAGGYGTLYNYHWLLDDLQWPRTAAFPDAGLALDNGTALSVRTLGFTLIPAWGTLPNLPPYCFSGDCAVGPFLYNAISPRLETVPEQQMLILSNQKDLTQQGDALFDDEAFWINSIRESYCDTKDLPGIHYYLTSESEESVHVVSIRPEFWNGSVAGEVMRDWFEGAIDDPDNVEDRAEEGEFQTNVPGVTAFPCPVAP